MAQFLKQLPGHRLELGLAAVLAISSLILVWWNREAESGITLALVSMELLLPMALGMIAAGLLAGDPALDLLLSVPRPAPRTLAQRLTIVLGIGALLGSATQGLVALWGIDLPISGPRQSLIWAAPTLLYVGQATAAALLRGQMVDGLVVTAAAWGATLITMPFIGEICSQSRDNHCLAALVSPAMTLIRAGDHNWLLNRLIWLGLGFLLLAIGLLLARREEVLITAHTRRAA